MQPPQYAPPLQMVTWINNPEVIAHQCGSSCSIRTCKQSLKFVRLPFPKLWLIFRHRIYLSGDLDVWHFDLGTSFECRPWHDNLPSNCDASATCPWRVWANMRQTHDVNVDLWLLRSSRMSLLRIVVPVLHPYTEFLVLRPSDSEDLWHNFGHGVLTLELLQCWMSPWHRRPSCQFRCFSSFCCRANARQTNDMTLCPWPLTF